MTRSRVRIALQKKGRLREPSMDWLRTLGLISPPPANEQTFMTRCTNADVDFLYVRHVDVPQYVESGTADFGIVGGNVLYEEKSDVVVIDGLKFGGCSLVVAVPNSSEVRDLSDLDGERIVTSYPNSLRKFLKKRNIKAAVITIRGSVEIAPTLGLADAICDLTQTGRTLAQNELKPIETLLDFSATLIESPFEDEQKQQFKQNYLAKGYEKVSD